MNKSEIKEKLKKNLKIYQTYKPWEIINEYLPFGLVLDSGQIVYVALYGLERNFLGTIMMFDSLEKLKTYEFMYDYEGKNNLLKRAEQYFAQEGLALTREPERRPNMTQEITDQYNMKLTRYKPYHVPETVDLKKDLEFANNVVKKINSLSFLIHNGLDNVILNKFHPVINGKGLIPIFDIKNDSEFRIKKEVLNLKKEKFKKVKFNNELLAAKLKQKMRYGSCAMEFFYSTAPVPSEESKNDFVFMNGIILLDFSNEYMEPILLKSRIDEDPAAFVNEFAQELLDFEKLPAEVLVRDQKTYAILSDLLKQLNISVSITEDIPEIEEIENDMYEYENERRHEPIELSLSEINEYIDNLSSYSDNPYTNRLLKNLMALKEDMEKEFGEDGDYDPDS